MPGLRRLLTPAFEKKGERVKEKYLARYTK
jgi:hypothetical protein